MVPERLKKRWNLIIGDSTVELPKLLRSLRQVDVFAHDSLHEYRQMMFEYEEAWPFIRDGGLLVSDDIEKGDAFRDFAESKRIATETFARGIYGIRFGYAMKEGRHPKKYPSDGTEPA